MIQLDANLAAVRDRIDEAARAAGRAPEEVRLLPVTKSVPPTVAEALARRGWTELAENRADGLLAKAESLEASGLNVSWHFIGHLQRNKAGRVLERAAVVHSVDSLRLAGTLVRLSAERDKQLGVYLQVHLTGEAEKSGLSEDELDEAVRLVAGSPHLDLLGLMAMGPRSDSASVTTSGVFERTRALGEELVARHPGAFVDDVCRYSMGMSGDLERAIAAGSTCVRVGSDLFVGVDPAAPEGEVPA